jgi:4-carboxymuconolactone decarboxylase
MANELEKKGLEVRTKLFGEKQALAGHEALKKFDPDFATFLNEQLFGGIWSRPGLPLKSRSMITIAALIALNRGPELRIHMRGGLNLGITPEELKEMILHLSQYSGFPTAVEAMRAFQEVTEPRQS